MGPVTCRPAAWGSKVCFFQSHGSCGTLEASLARKGEQGRGCVYTACFTGSPPSAAVASTPTQGERIYEHLAQSELGLDVWLLGTAKG